MHKRGCVLWCKIGAGGLPVLEQDWPRQRGAAPEPRHVGQQTGSRRPSWPGVLVNNDSSSENNELMRFWIKSWWVFAQIFKETLSLWRFTKYFGFRSREESGNCFVYSCSSIFLWVFNRCDWRRWSGERTGRSLAAKTGFHVTNEVHQAMATRVKLAAA